MKEFSAAKQLQVIRLYFQGFSFEEVANKCSVSIGSVSNIIAGLKAGQFPCSADITEEIDGLRELAVSLKQSNTNPMKAMTGLSVLSTMIDLGIEPSELAHLKPAIKACGSNDSETIALLTVAKTILEVEKNTALSYSELKDQVVELESKAAQLDPLVKEAAAKKSELKKLDVVIAQQNMQISGNNKILANLQVETISRKQEKLKVDSLVADLEKRADQANSELCDARQERKILEKMGMSLGGLTTLIRQIKVIAIHLGLKPGEVGKRLTEELKLLNKGLGLKTLVKNRQQVLKETKQAIAKSDHEKLSLEAVVEDLQQHKQNLEASIQETTTIVRVEIENLIPATRATVQQIAAALKGGCSEALAIIYQLKEESIKVGQDIGQYQGILNESQWVTRLMALMHGEDGIDDTDVRTITLLVNGGISAWLEQHQAKSTAIGMLAISAGKFLKDVEQWQPKA